MCRSQGTDGIRLWLASVSVREALSVNSQGITSSLSFSLFWAIVEGMFIEVTAWIVVSL